MVESTPLSSLVLYARGRRAPLSATPLRARCMVQILQWEEGTDFKHITLLLSTGVASNVLAAIGELGEVGGEEMRPYVEELLPLIIETLQDQSSVAKREVWESQKKILSSDSVAPLLVKADKSPWRFPRAHTTTCPSFRPAPFPLSARLSCCGKH